jgi:hypothetical protein
MGKLKNIEKGEYDMNIGYIIIEIK